ncbi:hypothetical protein KAR91_59180 [Candidatus Pacearchaeota archaeon]|nr:hypothetical protein [Candidatus Pacearchaeota archaeon]
MKSPSHLKPWTRLGITKKQYKAARPWKATKMSRERYEKIILNISQEIIEEHRREAEANALMEAVFGKELIEELE